MLTKRSRPETSPSFSCTINDQLPVMCVKTRKVRIGLVTFIARTLNRIDYTYTLLYDKRGSRTHEVVQRNKRSRLEF